MSSRLKDRFLNSLLFRLTVAFAASFLLFAVILFGISYYKLEVYSSRQLDKRMHEQLHELRELYANHGIDWVYDDVQTLIDTSEFNDKLYRFYARDGQLMRQFASPSWSQVAMDKSMFEDADGHGDGRFADVSIPNEEFKGRLLYAALGDGVEIQMGFTSEKEDSQLRKILVFFVQMLLLVFLPLSLGIGWLMAHYATKDIRHMTRIATGISEGNLSLRMPEIRSKYEVAALSLAFNGMLDKIQGLIKEYRESTDSIAHDLRSPLTRITGGIEVLLSKPRENREYAEVLAFTKDELANLQSMINTLLDISSMEANVLADCRIVEVRGLFLKLVDIFQDSAEEKSISLEMECPADLTMLANASYMTRALSNLLDNAIKYMPPGGGRIRLVAEAVGRKAVLTVSDTGIGITHHDLPRIFDRFYRSDESRATPGNGLGLSFVSSVVHAHGGTVEVRSEPGQGAEFIMTL
jgi:signal transduction histidine kinase